MLQDNNNHNNYHINNHNNNSNNNNHNNLLYWNIIQSHILTGGGKLDSYSKLNEDFKIEDLPHYLLEHKISRKTFLEWLRLDHRSNDLIGAWKRPIFLGGWKESSYIDTDAFNLQTPSIFIDMRFPTVRPFHRLNAIVYHNLHELSDLELRLLSRQHCFAGYTYLESNSSSSSSNNNSSSSSSSSSSSNSFNTKVFTRHHIIDWNYHPFFPRSRPNRWFIQVSPPIILFKNNNNTITTTNNSTNNSYNNTSNSTNNSSSLETISESFKEYSTIRDDQQVPLYMERWTRLSPIAEQTKKYLAFRKIRPCPNNITAYSNNNDISSNNTNNDISNNIFKGQHEMRDAVLVVVGNHFSIAIDRDYNSLMDYMYTIKHFNNSINNNNTTNNTTNIGAGPAFIDHLLTTSDESTSIVPYTQRRKVAEDYLSLIGCYGLVSSANQSETNNPWEIVRSTFPWLEGNLLFNIGDISSCINIQYDFKSMKLLGIKWELHNNNDNTNNNNTMSHHIHHCLGEWEILECSFTYSELLTLFPNNNKQYNHTMKSFL